MNVSSEAQRKASARVAQEFALTLFASQQEQALKQLFNKDQLKQIDDWIKRQAEPLDRPEAIRRLVEIGLRAHALVRKRRSPNRRAWKRRDG
jgi:hypothetical protein